MHRNCLAACLAAALAAWAAPARAAPPATFTYSGFLTTPAGASVTTATDLTFRFYDAAIGGSQVGPAEVITVTPAADGYFAAVVGARLPDLAALFANRVWMSVQVQGDDAEMTPRLAFTSVPSALAVDWSGVANRPGACPADQFLRGFDASGAAVCASLPAGNPGTVTTVGATAPLTVATPTTTPTLSMAKAGSATNGWLSSADWTAFDGKQAPVTGSCAAGSSIRVVNPNGTVTCQTDTNSGGTVTSVVAGAGLTGGTITGVGALAIDPAHANSWSADQTFAGQAIVGLERNVSSSSMSQTTCANYSPCFTGSTAASCSTGKRLLGGGCVIGGSAAAFNGNTTLERSEPVSDTMWICRGSSAVSAGLAAYAICARLQ